MNKEEMHQELLNNNPQQDTETVSLDDENFVNINEIETTEPNIRDTEDNFVYSDIIHVNQAVIEMIHNPDVSDLDFDIFLHTLKQGGKINEVNRSIAKADRAIYQHRNQNLKQNAQQHTTSSNVIKSNDKVLENKQSNTWEEKYKDILKQFAVSMIEKDKYEQNVRIDIERSTKLFGDMLQSYRDQLTNSRQEFDANMEQSKQKITRLQRKFNLTYYIVIVLMICGGFVICWVVLYYNQILAELHETYAFELLEMKKKLEKMQIQKNALQLPAPISKDETTDIIRLGIFTVYVIGAWALLRTLYSLIAECRKR